MLDNISIAYIGGNIMSLSDLSLINKEKHNRTIANLLKERITGKVLSVGCGNGEIDFLLNCKYIYGLEIRNINCMIPLTVYGGETIPYPDKSFDTVIFVNSLHHYKNKDATKEAIKEAKRVAIKKIIIVDHAVNNFLMKLIVGLYDFIANPIGTTTFNYLNLKEWKEITKGYITKSFFTTILIEMDLE